jgi:hypothetical protein
MAKSWHFLARWFEESASSTKLNEHALPRRDGTTVAWHRCPRPRAILRMVLLADPPRRVGVEQRETHLKIRVGRDHFLEW